MALTDRQKVLVLTVGDKDSTVFSNDELDFLLDQGGEVVAAASLGCLAIAGSEAKSAIIWQSGRLKIDKSKIPEVYFNLADKYSDRQVPKEIWSHWSADINQFGEDLSEFIGDSFGASFSSVFDTGD